MKVAAYQAPLLPSDSIEAALGLIRAQVARCESGGIEILCCPEGVLGGLADYASEPTDIAIAVDDGMLEAVLAPLASDTVTTIVGFTEIDRRGRLYNSAAVYGKGTVQGVYRKAHPAINRSVYHAGDEMPVFTVGELTFGILICRDTNFAEPARTMVARGATAIFVPTNNGLPLGREHAEPAAQARRVDIARAIESGVSIIRADVAGRTDRLIGAGASAIIDRTGLVLQSLPQFSVGLLVGDIDTTRRPRRLTGQ